MWGVLYKFQLWLKFCHCWYSLGKIMAQTNNIVRPPTINSLWFTEAIRQCGTNIGSGNSLFSGINEPLPEPTVACHQGHAVALISRAISTQVLKISICKLGLKITLLKSLLHLLGGQWVNSLAPSDPIWRLRSGSTLAQVMACCLTAPSHYLNQCWLIISDASTINH